MNNLEIRNELVDNYEHIDSNLEYIIENILQSDDGSDEYKNLELDFQSSIIKSCNCELNSCENDGCLHGGNYKIRNNQLVLREDRKSKDLIYECNENCECSNVCLNKLVQFGPIDGLEIQNFGTKGCGLITTKKLLKGTFICEYAGEILTKSEAIRRDQSNNSMNYILCLNEISSESNSNKIQTFIDPSMKGNIGRYLNHSCDPNCEILSVRVDSIIPKIAIFAKRDICENEELTFSYGTVDLNFINENNKKFCYCGAQNCKTYLPNLTFC
ncbi:probable histone-lysine N-methyltransferase set-23 [Chironomus tepperi]|uniref:probable histone-lysine N-methyltransferase set-23 n=1 Tax=Chironomus tepperi TaxID=113505 RepID=UPI00391EEB1E